ncbi:uncharacterized protein BP5553_04930 [Venustampulla echinocandica]|uniref:Amine oxidase domain-containing protein n=1 Tax=Venustampulla echinocandica TaxID=2656787 RepID=A0A370TPN7_9HELO|nr:uncharacterized protein BP5553_04930 [Venustampulla echinocandica]RDL37497.1 hypothetical protein BP5553_04930 [Venustampulla echinocandica]
MTLTASNALLSFGGILLLASLRAEAALSVTLNGTPCSVDNIVTRDVCIIGGGSTGTYSAIRLSDLGKTVMVVEEKNRLGGHTETYHDPVTGTPHDYSVVVWHDLDIVRNYFARLNVSLVKSSAGGSGAKQYFDFQTGKPLPNYSPGDPTPGLAAYAAQLAKYPYVEEGFDLHYPVPSDLLLPFGQFVKKHNLQSMGSLIFGFAQGLGDVFAQPTLYVMKNFGSDILKNIKTGFLTTAEHDNSLLYEHATADLGPNVLLNSQILAVDRSDREEAKVLVKTPSGVTLVKSRKLVFTIPPKLENLRGWDLSALERSLFRQFSNSGYYTAILRNSGLPSNLSLVNVSPHTEYNHAALPGLYGITPTGIENLLDVKYGSVNGLPDDQVKKDILSTAARLQVPGRTTGNPELAVYSRHTPFELTVPPKAIAGGFYKRLYGLQGQRHTYYTGAAFHTHDSSLLWQFTEALLPNITAV